MFEPHKHQRRYWTGLVLGAFGGGLAAIAHFWPDWIEAVSGWDDGSVEKYIAVTAILVLAVALYLVAAREAE